MNRNSNISRLFAEQTDGEEFPSGNPTMASILTQKIRDDIITGALHPGSKLRLKDLAARYSAGVIPLREALSRLATTGFVNAEDQRGFSVAGVSEKELIDISRTREMIECEALRESIAEGDIEWESKVLSAFHRMSRLPMLQSPEKYLLNADWDDAHTQFHEALLSGCKSEWTLRFARILRDQTSRYRHLSFKATESRVDRDVQGEHKAIVEAVMQRDADTACSLLKEHFRATIELVLKQLK